MTSIIHNEKAHRFETTINGHTAYLSYIELGNVLNYNHTIVPDALGGQGVGKSLAKYALEYARENGKKVIPSCSFVDNYITKNPEYQDLLA